MKQKTLNLPIKGSYYYSADLAYDLGLFQPKTRLKLVLEPDNQQDKHAVQIWLNHFPSWLIGYIPRRKARFIGFLLHKELINSTHLKNISLKDDCLKLRLTISYRFSWRQRIQYWLNLLGFSPKAQ